MKELTVKEANNGIIIEFRNYNNNGNGQALYRTEVIENFSLTSLINFLDQVKGGVGMPINPQPSMADTRERMKIMGISL
jgi:hypothetical protein